MNTEQEFTNLIHLGHDLRDCVSKYYLMLVVQVLTLTHQTTLKTVNAVHLDFGSTLIDRFLKTTLSQWHILTTTSCTSIDSLILLGKSSQVRSSWSCSWYQPLLTSVRYLVWIRSSCKRRTPSSHKSTENRFLSSTIVTRLPSSPPCQRFKDSTYWARKETLRACSRPVSSPKKR